MKIRLNPLAVLAATATLLLAPQASAQQWSGPCGNWEVGGHALLFQPLTCTFDYAAITPANPNEASQLPVASLKCELDWGFRLFGRFLWDCSYVGASYQWYESKMADQLVGAALQSRLQIAGQRAKATQTLRYQNVDMRWGKYVKNQRTCSFHLFGTGRWIDLELHRAIRTTNVQNQNTIISDVVEKGALRGGALGVGAAAAFDVWCDVGLFGEAALLGVIADRTTSVRLRQIQTAGPASVGDSKYGSDTCVVPEASLKLGANYTRTCGRWTFVGELGYEVDYFWNAFAFSRDATPSFRHCEDAGFAGLFFGGRVLF